MSTPAHRKLLAFAQLTLHASLWHLPMSLSTSHHFLPWGILSHIFWPKLQIYPFSPGQPRCASIAPHSFFVKPLLCWYTHSLCNTHPHPNSTDLFPPQCFSYPAAESPILVLLLLHSSVLHTSLRLLYLYLYIVFFTAKCFLWEKSKNISSWLFYAQGLSISNVTLILHLISEVESQLSPWTLPYFIWSL